MKQCQRCRKDVPDFLWVGNDHPVMMDHPVTVHRTPIEGSITEFKVSVHAYILAQMCSNVNREKPNTILELTVSTPLEEAVSLALGAAATCWESKDGTGTFQADRCAQISKELVDYFRSKGPIY